MQAVAAEQSVPAAWGSAARTGLRQTLWHGVESIARRDVVQIAAGCFAATIVSLRILGRVDQPMLLWPFSGMALALALPNWRLGWSKRLSLLASAVAGLMTAAAPE